MIQPVMVIGLGAAGTAALDEIARGLQQAYGTAAKNAVALIAFTAQPNTPQPQHDWVKAYPSFSPPMFDAWVKKSPSALYHWFDTSYHLRSDRLHPLTQTQDERQVVRARFVAQFANDVNHHLVAFLEARRERLLSIVNGHTIRIDLLADSDDPNTAYLLDIANLVSSLFDGHSIHLMLHLALSASWQADTSTPDRAFALARSFAILRELNRFTTSYGATQHTVYAEDSGLERYNTANSAFITAIKVYRAASPDDLAQTWADVLLPQMERPINRERSTAGFGSHYEQFNMVNWHSLRQNRVDKSGQRYSLYVGSYDTYTALFPLAQLQQHWAARLSRDALRAWLGEPPQDDREALRVGLFDTSFQNKTGAVLCPHMVARLTTLTPQDIENVQMLETLLYREEARKRGSNPDVVLLASDYQEHLTWQPNLDRIESYGLDALDKKAQANIAHRATGYTQALDSLTDSTYKRFTRALSAYITFHLTDAQGAGIRTVYGVVTRLLADVRRAYDLITQQVKHMRVSQANTLHRLRDEAGWAAGNIERFRGGVRRQPTRELLTYVHLLEELWEAQRYQIALASLHRLTERLFKTIEPLQKALHHWADVLWKTPESLLPEVTARAAQPIVLKTYPQRRWLYDEQWQHDIYENRLSVDILPYLRDKLRWVFKESDDTWTPHIGHHAADAQEALAWWLNESATQVAQARVDLWNDYLLPNQTYQRRLQDIRALFAQPQSAWPKESSVSEDLILPKTMMGTAQGIDTLLLDVLHEQDSIRVDVHESEDSTRLVRYRSHEVFGLFEMPAYQEAQRAYQALDPERRARLHVLPAECEAVHWEVRSKRLLQGRSIMFENSVVALLTHQPKLEQFIWLNALQLVRIQSYDSERHYEMTFPDGMFFWLDDTGASLLEAVTNFVFKAKMASFKVKPSVGQPKNIVQRPLPSSRELDDAIMATLHERTARRETVYDDALRRLRQRLEGVAQAILQIEKAQALLDYDTALASHIPIDAPYFDEEQQLLILLRLIAQEHYYEYRQRIDRWI